MTPPERPAAPVSLFYSYSSKDGALRNKLETHLTLLRRQGYVSVWHDRRVVAGTEWERQIDQHLEAADVILLLVSPDFIASNYCYDIEMTRALGRHEAGTARVIPIILRPCDWKTAPFGKLQALPRDGKPVTTWGNRDEAFEDVARGLREVVNGLTSVAQNPPAPAQPTPVVTPPPAGQARAVDRAALVRTVSGLSPSDLARLVMLVEGAASHVSRHGTVPEQAAELVRWAESPTGPGLVLVEEALERCRKSRDLAHSLAAVALSRQTPEVTSTVPLFERKMAEQLFYIPIESALVSEFAWPGERAHLAVFVLRELMDNAFEHGCREAGELTVTFSAVVGGGGEELTLVVRSPGVGFDFARVLKEKRELGVRHQETRGRGLLFVRLAARELIASSDGRVIQAVVDRKHESQELSALRPTLLSIGERTVALINFPSNYKIYEIDKFNEKFTIITSTIFKSYIQSVILELSNDIFLSTVILAAMIGIHSKCRKHNIDCILVVSDFRALEILRVTDTVARESGLLPHAARAWCRLWVVSARPSP
jgi:anti-sigma regulatory factor (Ser/Thr protein kinase)